MARVTIEDCEAVVQNRFDLVLLAAQRTRQVIAGDPVTVEMNDEKKPVVALREIAARTVSAADLSESLINSFRAFVPDDLGEDGIDNLEEDTYNPYVGIESATEGGQVVSPVPKVPLQESGELKNDSGSNGIEEALEVKE